VPGRKFKLSSQRLLNQSITAKLTIALSAPAFAVAAIMVGSGMSAPAAAQPVSQIRLVSVMSSDSALRSGAHASGASNKAAASSRRLSDVDARAKTHRKHRKSYKRLTAKDIAWDIMGWFHWRAKQQFRYLNWLWMQESSWNVYATNPYSGAYGIPQALPAGKMASCGNDWRTDAKTQIRWGMRYIKAVYGSPQQAWAHEVDFGWY
jgi:hypothetical protein